MGGNASEWLVEATDAAGRARGFWPPHFVDIRFRRREWARGFIGNAVRDFVGSRRYDWIQEFGNAAIGQIAAAVLGLKRPGKSWRTGTRVG